MTITAAEGLEARENLLWICDHWTALRARLRPGGGAALTGMPTGSESQLPIDTGVSDLMLEIEDHAEFYAQALLDETDDFALTSIHMPGILRSVAERYGHFSAGDPKTALDFCDTAHEMRRRVDKTLTPPPPAKFMGPCRVQDCVGELYLRDDREEGTCGKCGKKYTRVEQMDWVGAQMADRLMTASEIVSALHVLDLVTPIDTVKSWVRRGKIVEAEPGTRLYRLAEAQTLAERGRMA